VKRTPMRRSSWDTSRCKSTIPILSNPGELKLVRKPIARMSERMDGPDRACVAVPKFEYVRSEPLMRAYGKLPCQHCGRDDKTICGAHSNWAAHGKGRGVKATDVRCASLCSTCHTELDQGHWWTVQQRKSMWWRAHVKTIARLQAELLWPAKLPVPDIENCPWELV
jgi:hypothetical protein